MGKVLVRFSLHHPRTVVVTVLVCTLFFAAVLPNMETDTDPVKMLDQSNPAILLYNGMKEEFKLADMMVVGLFHRNGESLFTAERLQKIHRLEREILKIRLHPPKPSFAREVVAVLRWLRSETSATVSDRLIVEEDVIGLSSVDNIILNEKGELAVVPLMHSPPKTEKQAREILKSIGNNAILRGKLASTDGTYIGIFIPIEKDKKVYSRLIGKRIGKIASELLDPDMGIHLAGLPFAESTFGTEMFLQMAVYAPLAGLVIFVATYLFFGSFRYVSVSMVVALITVIWAMGGLVASGNKVHIMSSMIPIFLLPIALLDSIHIVSRLYDRTWDLESKKTVIWRVMEPLYRPMLYTSLTTMVAFGSLALTGIQPVEVFGLTVGFGVAVAWLLSMTFVPALLVRWDSLPFYRRSGGSGAGRRTALSIFRLFQSAAMERKSVILVLGLAVSAFSAFGIHSIVVNDNPVRWFKLGHPVRQADSAMNRKLAGTYMANLIFELNPPHADGTERTEEEGISVDDFESALSVEEVGGEESVDLKDGETIRYIERVQNFLLGMEDGHGNRIVGAATSIADILKKVGKTAFGSETIPKERAKIAQYIFLYEAGDPKRGKDLWKFITRDYQKSQIWLQLKNGDNRTMNSLIDELEAFRQANPPPDFKGKKGGDAHAGLTIRWSGLTYINTIWQEEMVKGMAYALLTSFFVVLLMMWLLFRSLLWSLISMIPLTLSIALIYGIIGWSGKYYDMPIAVLSCLALGLSIDFAIHFNQSFREAIRRTGSISLSMDETFANPCFAIGRNVVVLSVGFTPLFFATLVPYVTVGAFFFAIILISGAASFLLLPSLICFLRNWLPDVRGSQNERGISRDD